MHNKKFSNVFLSIIVVFFVFLGVIALSSSLWYIKIFGDMGFDSIIYTLFSNLTGSMGDFLLKYFIGAIVPSVIITAIICFILFRKSNKGKKTKKKSIYPFKKGIQVLISIILCIVLVASAMYFAGVYTWINGRLHKGTLYEDEYVSPDSVNISFPEKKRNLIYIFLESMETTFFKKQEGGALKFDVIPELRELAANNINFSQNDTVGGFTPLTGSTWTMGAMVAQTSGIPLCLPIDNYNNGGYYSKFLPGVLTLNDILKENGYYQTLMVGSDATFGGRQKYFTQHGVDKIYDIFTAREDGVVPSDYSVWWGMEDLHLFEYAKQELTKISKSDKPFNFTMLTVDTHHVGGYYCSQCKNEFSEQYENVFACSSKQVAEFVNWIKEQEFYENTTIVICGDHCSMDDEYIKRNVSDDYHRRVYNCIINSPILPQSSKNREVDTFDLFPTTLAAIGCKIEGDRLGLGSNLFSNKKTLIERFGIEKTNKLIGMTSSYYENEFLYGDK